MPAGPVNPYADRGRNRPCHGVLRVSRYGPQVGPGDSLVHRSRFVNGPEYAGMSDNDIRGFLTAIAQAELDDLKRICEQIRVNLNNAPATVEQIEAAACSE